MGRGRPRIQGMLVGGSLVVRLPPASVARATAPVSNVVPSLRQHCHRPVPASKAAARNSFSICALGGPGASAARAEWIAHGTAAAAVVTCFRNSRRLAGKRPRGMGEVRSHGEKSWQLLAVNQTTFAVPRADQGCISSV